MQIVSNGDNLHDKSSPVFWKKKGKYIINLSSAELAQRVVKVEKLDKLIQADGIRTRTTAISLSVTILWPLLGKQTCLGNTIGVPDVRRNDRYGKRPKLSCNEVPFY